MCERDIESLSYFEEMARQQFEQLSDARYKYQDLLTDSVLSEIELANAEASCLPPVLPNARPFSTWHTRVLHVACDVLFVPVHALTLEMIDAPLNSKKQHDFLFDDEFVTRYSPHQRRCFWVEVVSKLRALEVVDPELLTVNVRQESARIGSLRDESNDLPNNPTRPITKSEAAAAMGYDGNAQSKVRRLNTAIKDGLPCVEMSRQQFVFSCDSFPKEAQDRIRKNN